MTKVLYIAGWGRSGTTLLDNLLNSYDSVFSVGELSYLWLRGLKQRGKCGCGTRVPDCALWQEILHVAYGNDPPAAGEIYDLQRRSLRVRQTLNLLRPRPDPDVERYRQVTGRLYEAIAEVTGARLIVDSSKSPPPAAVLPEIDGVEPYLLYMLRDPRAVAHSWMRGTAHADPANSGMFKHHSPAESTVQWVGWSVLIERVARAYPGRHRRLRYEDLLVAPRTTVEELLGFVGVPPVGGPFVDERTVRLEPNHTVSGNPSRFRTGELVLRVDDRWLEQQQREARLVASALSLPLLPRYRYPVLPRQLRPGDRASTEVPR